MICTTGGAAGGEVATWTPELEGTTSRGRQDVVTTPRSSVTCGGDVPVVVSLWICGQGCSWSWYFKAIVRTPWVWKGLKMNVCCSLGWGETQTAVCSTRTGLYTTKCSWVCGEAQLRASGWSSTSWEAQATTKGPGAKGYSFASSANDWASWVGWRVRRCVLTWPDWLKRWWHRGHSYGLAPVWISWWRCRLNRDVKCLWQCSHSSSLRMVPPPSPPLPPTTSPPLPMV